MPSEIADNKPNMRKYMLVLLKITAIHNAIQLGWSVNVRNDKIILRKKIKDLTKLDKNTVKLLEAVMNLNKGCL